MGDGADLCLALAKAETDSELSEHVREYGTAIQERAREEREVAMQIPDKFWIDTCWGRSST